MKRLFTFRHAEYGSPSNKIYSLNENGLIQTKNISEYLSKSGYIPNIILTSPYQYAKEMADILGESLKVEVIERDYFRFAMFGDSALEQTVDFIRTAFRHYDIVVIICHGEATQLIPQAAAKKLRGQEIELPDLLSYGKGCMLTFDDDMRSCTYEKLSVNC